MTIALSFAAILGWGWVGVGWNAELLYVTVLEVAMNFFEETKNSPRPDCTGFRLSFVASFFVFFVLKNTAVTQFLFRSFLF